MGNISKILGMDNEENSIPLLPLKKAVNPGGINECILVVGTTGTGKTTTVNLYTGSDLPVGDTAQAMTTTTVTVEDSLHPGKPGWVDNPGWLDTEGKSDAMVFKRLLRHLQSERLHRVAAVVWCVTPQPRMTSVLQDQARLIDMFMAKDQSRIWSNVIILCNGMRNAKTDCQGAVEAAKLVYIHAKPQTLTTWKSAMVGGTKMQGMMPEKEIRDMLEAELSSLPPSLKVVFANQKCRSCGQTGDPRLMEDLCHRTLKRGHIGELDQRFSKAEVGFACAGGGVGIIGLSTAAALVPGGELILLGLPMVMGPGAVMSGHRFLNTGSTSAPPCGGIKITDMRYTCCGMQELAPGGCTDFCDNPRCYTRKALWGERGDEKKPPGCVMIRHPDSGAQKGQGAYEYVEKDHDLVDIVTKLS